LRQKRPQVQTQQGAQRVKNATRRARGRHLNPDHFLPLRPVAERITTAEYGRRAGRAHRRGIDDLACTEA
jgi:hypothetical protein